MGPPAFGSMGESLRATMGAAVNELRKHMGSTEFGSHRKHRRYGSKVLSREPYYEGTK